MKKIVIGFLICLLLINYAGAISSDIKNGSYSPSETMLIKIDGNILAALSADNVKFYRGHVEVPVEYDLKKLGDNYYIWALAPTSENNYSLLVEDITTTISGVTAKVNYQANFSVSGDIVDYNIKPGFIFNEKKFDIDVFLNEDVNKEITTSFMTSSNFTLKPGANTISFDTGNLPQNTTQPMIITIGKYALPVYIIGLGAVSSAENASLPSFYFSPKRIEAEINSISDFKNKELRIVNDGDKDLKITIGYNKSIFSSSSKENVTIGAKEIYSFNISLIELPKDEISEIISAKSNSSSAIAIIEIARVGNATNVTTTYSDTFGKEGEKVNYYCIELRGAICSSSETCVGTTLDALDGACCIASSAGNGVCAKETTSSSYAWIGYLLIVIVVIGLIFIYLRYRKTKTLGLDVFKRKTEEAEKKVTGLP